LFSVIFVAGLAILFFLKGDKIQKIVNEKTEVTDVRAATIIDFIYALILFAFKTVSKVPMSTTWVFIGLLGGREVAMNILTHAVDRKNRLLVFKMIGKDIFLAFVGLVVSIILAISINPNLREELFSFFR
jgi:phosphate/sulfate permease